MPCSDHRSTLTENSGPTELGVGAIADGEYLRRSGDEIVGAAGGGGGSTASTTETLTGTDSSKSVTPDALAALWEQGSDIASAATISIGEGGFHHVTGTTDISDIDFATDRAGRTAILRFDDTLNLVQSANLLLPQDRNLTVFEDDIVSVVSEGSGVVRVVGHTPHYPKLWQILSANEAGANVNTAQPWFPTYPGAPVKANTTYHFVGQLWLSRAAGIAAHVTSVLFGGTATLTSISYVAHSKAGETSALAAASTTFANVATAIQIKASSINATEQIFVRVEGIVRINNVGTFTPQFQYNIAPGGAPTILADSFFILTPEGDGNVERAGAWA